jgi:hypothetical protein
MMVRWEGEGIGHLSTSSYTFESLPVLEMESFYRKTRQTRKQIDITKAQSIPERGCDHVRRAW